ncbi:MAG: 1-acyl-sn-glycerol-3-phosphate acyltransferase [Candidatus Accumulibacter sp.]|jgi:1-acyl-sn-glycerol-3-phosphate acyltransferase|nr:1-acyl-sn-glycerol-3-phosphate acyltransferase [Accumulibacter sp.]
MLERFLRIIATGFCFAIFGLGGLVILCVVFPLLRLFYPDSRESRDRARAIIHHSFRCFVRLMVVCGTISYEVQNMERLDRRGLLIVANHPSLIDVVLLISLVRHSNCVVKASLRDDVFTRGPVQSAGFIVNTDGPQLIEDCIASVRSGDNLIIFPEGTRSLEYNGAPNPLKRGAVTVALRGNLALTPVVITVSEPMLSKKQRWYHAPRRRPHFVLKVEDDIPMTRYRVHETAAAPSRMTRVLSGDLQAFFTRKIKRQCAN